MADKANKVAQNVPGKYYVDADCITCDACVTEAPDFFEIDEEEGYAFVKVQPKTKEEIETHVEDFDKVLKIFEKIGLTTKRSYEKYRVSYKLGNITFEIDVLPNLPIPPWIEIEAPSQKEVEEMVEKLGFKKEDMKSYDGLELLEHYNIHQNDLK